MDTQPTAPEYVAPNWLRAEHPRPPNDNVGDATPEAIFTSVGRLTHTWEMVENSLAALFTGLCETKSPAAMFAFGAVVGSGARCDMIEAAARFYCKSKTSPEQAGCLIQARSYVKIARELASLRNIFAHGVVVRQDPDGFIAKARYSQHGEYFITPASYSTNKTDYLQMPKRWFASRTIVMIADEMALFRAHLDCFTFRNVFRTRFEFGDSSIILIAKKISRSRPSV